MHEIKIFIPYIPSGRLNTIPADMRYFLPARKLRKTRGLAGDYAQTIKNAEFMPLAKHQLRAKADSEHRLICGSESFYGIGQAADLEPPHSGLKRTDARQNNRVRI